MENDSKRSLSSHSGLFVRVSNAVVHAANTAVITGIQRTLFTFIVPVVLLRDVKIDRAPGAQLLRYVALNLTTFVVLAIRAVRIAAHIRRFWKV